RRAAGLRFHVRPQLRGPGWAYLGDFLDGSCACAERLSAKQWAAGSIIPKMGTRIVDMTYHGHKQYGAYVGGVNSHPFKISLFYQCLSNIALNDLAVQRRLIIILESFKTRAS